MELKGIVFNIQRFSTHDGPGIRTTVFLKGCPLTCHWCANPESQSQQPQLMVRDLKCSGCGECAEACPEKAIVLSKAGKRVLDWQKCNHCFACVPACLYDSLTIIGEYKTVKKVIEVVDKDQIFYQNSNGGVTISGGEPLVQHVFLESLLLGLKKGGYHITLDTTGFASTSVVRKIVPLVDLVLFDIKHLDSETHQRSTGVNNTIILDNARYIARHVRTWFRIPLIAGYNDEADHIRQIAELAAESGVEKISFLPFHEGGVVKNSQMGENKLNFIAKPPSDEHIQNLVAVAAEHRVKATVGS